MSQLRLCSHIKTNGQKCGSPALRHHTMCYFHYQWQRRDQRRIRLGGPIGMNKNTGIELPLLDGPEAILISIMEIQRGLLDQRIPIKMGTALLYSLQLALQARLPRVGLCPSESVRECPELDMQLEMERAQALRPAKEKCAACPKQDSCLSPRGCKKLPKVPGYHRVDDRLVCDKPAESSIPEEIRSSVPPIFGSSVALLCHPERSAASSRGAEGPFVSPAEATNPSDSSHLETTTTSNAVLESSPADRSPRELVRGVRANCGEQAPPKFPPSGAPHLPHLADVGSGAVEGPASRSSVPPIFGSSVAPQLGTENRELGN